jgi:YHS domain-containing protein
MTRSRTLLAGLFALTILLVSSAAFAEPLTPVEAKRVCMVNDTAFPKDQIPVQVDGKTYFGCCEMCKGRLAQDPTARSAVDPVSGKAVDKATAVIGATSDGKVLYFESQKTFDQYSKRT